MAKKSSSNAIKKLDEQIKALTPESEEKEALPIIDKRKIEKKAKEVVEKTPVKKTTTKKTGTKKTTTKKTATKKTASTKSTSTKTKSTTKKTTTKRKTTTKKTQPKKATTRKKTTDKPVVVEERPEIKAREITPEEVKKVVEKNKGSKYNKKELSESTLKMKKFEKHFRNLYDKVNDVVEDIDYVKTVNTESDVVISDIEKRSEDRFSRIDNINSGLLHKITLVLLGIFIVFFIIVLAIIIYICTY